MILLYILLIGILIFVLIMVFLILKSYKTRKSKGKDETKINTSADLARVSPKKPPLSIVYAYGTPFDFGYSIGKQTKYAIRRRLKQKKFDEKLIPFTRQKEGRQILDGLIEINRRIFPTYFEELEGIAKGSDTPIEDIYVLNFRDELTHFADKKNIDGAVEIVTNDSLTRNLVSAFTPEDDCTDLHVNGKKINSSSSNEDDKDVLLGHNEDGKDYDIENIYLLIGEVHNIDNSVSRFTTLSFAGESFNAIGCNEHMGFAFNALEPNVVPELGIGRNFIARALLDAKNIKEAINIINIGEPNQSFGHSYNIADFDTNTTYNIESAPGGINVLSNADTKDGFYFHANLYRRIDIPQKDSLSSEHRLKMVESLPIPKSIKDIRSILGNTQDKEFPVYRSNLPTDGGTTLYSVIFNVTKKKVFIFNSNPAYSDPFIEMRMTV